MSCGRPHELDCDEVLERVYVFLDREIAEGEPVTYARIEQHLLECGPCLAEVDVERIVKVLLQRCCRSEHASSALRSRIMTQLSLVRVDGGESRPTA